jgi:hypothetical protein
LGFEKPTEAANNKGNEVPSACPEDLVEMEKGCSKKGDNKYDSCHQ